MKTTLAFMVLLIGCSPAYGQGTLVYDQSSSSGGLASGGSSIQNQQPMGQSFTPTFSSIGFVQFQFADTVGTQGATVYVRLLEGSIIGNLLSTSFPVYLPNGFLGVTNFFFPTEVSLVAGQEYFFNTAHQSGDNIAVMGGLFNYTRGSAQFNGVAVNTGLDLWFREGIVVPEPSSFLIVVISSGLAILIGRKRH